MVRRTTNDLRSNPVVDDQFLNEVVRRILSVGSPRRIVLFGSHARGEAHDSSDLDLMIIEDRCDQPPQHRATNYRMALTGVHPAKDIVVYDVDEVREWAGVAQAFVTTALREGRMLYEKP
ncbi:MAG: nucleotidyltransferase domain-containing protein [Planctomycetes bacterium]|nr:nucleotidyltransferase domain-containing protein [Planctomycetota bacterium]